MKTWKSRIATARSDQHGMGLILVLVIGAAIFGMGTTAMLLFTGASNQSQRHVKFEQGLHIAEHGVDKQIAKLQKDLSATTTWDSGPYSNTSGSAGTNPNWHKLFIPSSVNTIEEEEAWAREVFASTEAATQLAACTDCATPEGQFLVLRPHNRKTIYAMSWIPSRANAKFSRLVKAEYLPASFRPVAGILTGGNLEFTGSAEVHGSAGNVHANGNINANGGGTEVDGTMTTSGVFTAGPGGTVHGGFSSGQPKMDVPVIEPRKVWNDAKLAGIKEGFAYAQNWYDLCPDGTVRYPSGLTPCTGIALAGNATANPGIRGWKYQSSIWKYIGSGSDTGTFYAYQGNIDISGSPGKPPPVWQVTLITEAQQTGTTAAGCPILANGDIKITGSPAMQTFLSAAGIAMLAGRDLDFKGGGTAAAFQGMMAAKEQFDVQGNATGLDGFLLAEDKCNTTGSPVGSNKVSGSFEITYNSDFSVSIGETIRTALWQEL